MHNLSDIKLFPLWQIFLQKSHLAKAESHLSLNQPIFNQKIFILMAVLVGKQAPDFTAKAVLPDNSFDEQFNKNIPQR